MAVHTSIELDATGVDFPMAWRRGCLWRFGGQIRDDGVPRPLPMGTIVRAVVTSGALSNVALKTFDASVTNYLLGTWLCTILEPDADLEVGTYWWAMEIDTGDGAEPLASGEFIVRPWQIESP